MNELMISNTSLGEILKCKMLLAYSSSRTGGWEKWVKKLILKLSKSPSQINQKISEKTLSTPLI